MKKNKVFLNTIPFVLFFTSLYLYLKTMVPSVYFGDSGELISMIYTLGLAHPTGFPFYIMLGKVFSLLPLANVAFKLNFMSGLFAAFIPVIIFYIVRILLKEEKNKILKYTLAISASLIFMSSYTVWSQAVAARIYTLNAFFCASALLLFLYFIEIKASNKALYLLALLTGIGAGLHISFIIFVFILWVYIAIKYFRVVKKNILWILFFMFVGLSAYIYIFIRGSAEALLQWKTLYKFDDLIEYISQKQYKHKMFSRNAQGYVQFFSYTKDVFIREFSLMGLILMIAGIILSFIKKQKYMILFTLLFLSNIILLSVYGTSTDLKISFRYYIPTHIISAIFITFFFYRLKDYIKDSKLIIMITPVIVMLLLYFMITTNYYENNRSKNYIAHNYPRDMFAFLPENANLFSSGDNQIYTIAYHKFVEGKRPDIKIFDSTNTIFRDIEELSLISGSSKVITNIIQAFKNDYKNIFSSTMIGIKVVSENIHGYVYSITKNGSVDRPYIWQTYSLNGILHNSTIFHEFEEREVVGTYLYRYAEYFRQKGDADMFVYLMEEAERIAYDAIPVLGNLAIIYSNFGAYEKSVSLLSNAVKRNPFNSELYFNLGSVYGRMGNFKKAIESFERTVILDPRNMNARIYLNKAKQQLNQEQIVAAMQKAKDANYESGLEHLKAKRFKEAIIEFTEDLKKNPEKARSNFHLGLAYSIQEDYKTAITFFEKADKKQPKNINTLNNMALTYLKLGNKKKAEYYFNKSFEVNRNQPRVEKLLLDMK